MMNPLNERLRKIADRLVCPGCQEPLKEHPGCFACPRCKRDYPVHGNAVFFNGAPGASEGTSDDILFRVKAWLKERRWVFRIAYFLQPALAIGDGPDAIAQGNKDPLPVFLNLGSGAPLYWSAGTFPLIQVDLHPYPGIDLVCDVNHLPFRNNAVNGIYNESLMEHTPDPAAIVKEVRRVLRPSGKAYFVLPQIAPYHAAPHDYTRWTLTGGKRLLESMFLVRWGVRHGPASAWLWLTQEMLATALSVGNSALYAVWLMLLMAISFPIKYLDQILARLPDAHRTALTLYFLVEKKEASDVGNRNAR